MSEKRRFSRREVVAGGANVIALGTAMSMLPAVGALAAVKPIKVGFIYAATRDDFGWNQAHAVAARKIAQLPGVSLVEQENVPETVEVDKVMEGMILQDGCKVLFPTSFGFWPFLKKMAVKYPDVLFVHAGGLWKPGDPKNTIGYRGYMEEPHYVAGIVAARMSKTGKFGFIGSKPLYFIFNNANGFIMGARSVRPDATMRVVITGSWDDPVKEAETTNGLIDQGVDVMVANVDSPKVVIENSERRGIYSVGYHTDVSSLAPKGFLTGAEWNWAKGGDFVQAWQSGGDYPNLYRGGFSRDMVNISPFGKAVPQNVRDEAMKAVAGFTDDSLKLYKGPLKDNEGNVILKAGEVISNTDNAWKFKVRFLVEGAIGKTGLKK